MGWRRFGRGADLTLLTASANGYASRLRFQPPPPGSLAVCNRAANLNFALPMTAVVSDGERRASKPDLHQVPGRSQSGCSATFSGSAELVMCVMGCCTRAGVSSIGCPIPSDTQGMSVLDPEVRMPSETPFRGAILALDRPAHKGCSGPSSWAEA